MLRQPLSAILDLRPALTPLPRAIVEAVRRLSEAGVGVDDLALRRPTLDDVFLALTGHAAEEELAAEEEQAA